MEKDFDDTISEQEKLFGELLDEIDEEEEEEEKEEEESESEEEKERKEKERLQKNKDAEEARKRREAAEKEKKRLEEEQKKAESESKDKRKSQEEELGAQLVSFTKKYPNVELKNLDEDKHFKRFISGKLLGKKDFIELYEEYIDFKKELSGKSESDIVRDYEKKRQASPGPLGLGGGDVETAEVYTTKELDDIASKIPFMTESQVAAVMAKYEKSIEYHSKK